MIPQSKIESRQSNSFFFFIIVILIFLESLKTETNLTLTTTPDGMLPSSPDAPMRGHDPLGRCCPPGETPLSISQEEANVDFLDTSVLDQCYGEEVDLGGAGEVKSDGVDLSGR